MPSMTPLEESGPLMKEKESINDPDGLTLEYISWDIEESLNDRWHFHLEKG